MVSAHSTEEEAGLGHLTKWRGKTNETMDSSDCLNKEVERESCTPCRYRCRNKQVIVKKRERGIKRVEWNMEEESRLNVE